MIRRNWNGIRLCAALWAFLAASGAGRAEQQLKIVDAAPGRPPSDAVVLFDGGSTDAFLNVKGTPCQWPVVGGAMVVNDGFIVSKLHFRDAQIHVEFAVPKEGKGGWAGNSGVYIFGMYEMQILDSYENPVEPKEAVGALYGISPPLVNVARKPGQWQIYDIVYIAPRRDAKGKVAQPGSITALLNGVLVQHNARFTESISRWNPLRYMTTPYTDKIRNSILTTGRGPLFLQDHHGSPVRFRNIWIRPLDGKAAVFGGR
jgi:hypothetical protein